MTWVKRTVLNPGAKRSRGGAPGRLCNNEWACLGPHPQGRALWIASHALSRERFVDVARACLEDIGSGLCEHAWLRATDVLYRDRILDAVPDPNQRLLACRFAAAVITADGQITPDEQMVYNHALARWRVSQAMVSQAILDDRTR